MSRTVRYEKEIETKPKNKYDRFAGLKRKYADFLMVDLWLEEFPIARKPSRKIRI